MVAFARHYVYDQRAPAHNKSIVADSARIRRDGTIVAAKLYRQTVDGTASAPDEIAKEQAELNKELPDEDYTLPLTAVALGDYAFGSPSACSGCDDGVVSVSFTSRKRDDDHGDGTAFVDEKNQRFVRLEFVPSVTPKGADSGSATIIFGRALSNLWDIVSEKQRYTGHLLFIHGSADVTITNRNYRRFDSLEQARGRRRGTLGVIAFDRAANRESRRDCRPHRTIRRRTASRRVRRCRRTETRVRAVPSFPLPRPRVYP